MSLKHVALSVVFISLLFASTALAQYEEDPFIEGFVGANLTLPTGYIKNDLDPDSLNAESGFGFDLGAGYHFSNKLIAGLYFSAQSMSAKEFDLTHRIFEFGGFGKYFVMDLTETRISPYIKLSAGLNFGKLVSKVYDGTQPVYRELSYMPTFGTAAAMGFQWKTNERGGIYLEAEYNYDMMKDVTGEFQDTDYAWEKNNSFIAVKAGVVFKIGRRE